MLEERFISHSAPTLAGLKTANLFTLPFSSRREAVCQLEAWNRELSHKDVYVTALRIKEKEALVYVYRKRKLEEILKKEGVMEFLQTYGYEEAGAAGVLDCLKAKFARSDEFPHEVGVFLGYPLEDVKGFIANGGKNCKCVGCWKVYCDECEAKKRFAAFQKCRRVYAALFQQGKTVNQLTVAV